MVTGDGEVTRTLIKGMITCTSALHEGEYNPNLLLGLVQVCGLEKVLRFFVWGQLFSPHPC